jgi:GTP-binding protein
MSKPLIALVGRPNVGKSTLFNKIAGKRISIAHDTPGVTRDRIYADAEWCGKQFTVIDTGGLEIISEDTMWMHIRKQAETAMDIADVIIFVADGRNGVMPDDHRIASYLRNTKKPVVLAVNKLDNPGDAAYEFYELGLGEPYAISAEHSKGIGDVLDAAVSGFKESESEQDSPALKIAVVGKPNAGKSSLVNKLLGFDRTIVTDIAGTTRDAIDTPFKYRDKEYILIDTAGIRRQRSVEEDVEYYSVIRAFAAIRRADIVLIVIDAATEITEQDVKIAGYVHEQGKPSILLMNKWDTIEKDTHTINRFNKILDNSLKFMDYYCPLYISALTGQRVERIMQEAEKVFENASRRISTGVLNDVVNDLISVNEPPTKNGRHHKIY